MILQERDKLVPVSLLQDVEEVRRSPAGAVIRTEGKIDHLGEDLSNFQRRFDALIARVATKEDIAHLSGRMNSIEGRMDGIEERMVTKEIMEARFVGMEAHFAGMEARFSGIEKRLDTYDFWLKLFGGVLTALMVAQLVAAFVK